MIIPFLGFEKPGNQRKPWETGNYFDKLLMTVRFKFHSNGALATALMMVEKPSEIPPPFQRQLPFPHPSQPCYSQSCGSNEQRSIDQLCVLQLRSSKGACRGIAKVGGILAEGPLYLAKMIVWMNQS